MQQRTILKWILLITAIGGITLAIRSLVERKVIGVYERVVSDPAIVSAFLTNDSTAIQEVAEGYKLEYQQVTQGKVTFATRARLPVPHIIPIRTVVASEVLPEDPETLLKTLVPYRMWRDGRLQIAIPLFSNVLDAPGYIVYVQVWP